MVQQRLMVWRLRWLDVVVAYGVEVTNTYRVCTPHHAMVHQLAIYGVISATEHLKLFYFQLLSLYQEKI
jgi:hypothetical protein